MRRATDRQKSISCPVLKQGESRADRRPVVLMRLWITSVRFKSWLTQ